MIYLELFLSFMQVGLFSIGGGYAALPFIENQAVNAHAWLTYSEFADLITIAEMTPGPIAINSATFVGIRIAGVLGAIVSTLGCVFPSMIIVTLLAYVYTRNRNSRLIKHTLLFLRPAVVALIASAGASILITAVFSGDIAKENFDLLSTILFIAAFALLRLKKIKPIPAMLLCGITYAGISLMI